MNSLAIILYTPFSPLIDIALSKKEVSPNASDTTVSWDAMSQSQYVEVPS
jgi:hypothetical protein